MSALSEILVEYAQESRNHPDAIGEILRAWAFVGKGYGCYSNFDVRPEFKGGMMTSREVALLMRRPYWNKEDQDVIQRAVWYGHPNGIEMGWYWDGDGVLCFLVPELVENGFDGTVYNTDCKKDYGWHFGEVSELQR